jgi:hypothetical protein
MEEQKSVISPTLNLILAIGVIASCFIIGILTGSTGGEKENSKHMPVVNEDNSESIKCVQASDLQLSAVDESRINEIILSVMQGGVGMPTAVMHSELWSILDQQGELCEEDIALTRETMTVAMECNRHFYQDVLYALHTGVPHKSSQRLDCENTIVALLSADEASERISENENLMRKIIQGQPISTASGDVVFTEEVIESTLRDIEAKLGRINNLFTRTFFTY